MMSGSGFKEQPKGFATKAIHAGQDPEQWKHLAVVPPLVTSTTFKQFIPGEAVVSMHASYTECTIGLNEFEEILL